MFKTKYRIVEYGIGSYCVQKRYFLSWEDYSPRFTMLNSALVYKKEMIKEDEERKLKKTISVIEHFEI